LLGLIGTAHIRIAMHNRLNDIWSLALRLWSATTFSSHSAFCSALFTMLSLRNLWKWQGIWRQTIMSQTLRVSRILMLGKIVLMFPFSAKMELSEGVRHFPLFSLCNVTSQGICFFWKPCN